MATQTVPHVVPFPQSVPAVEQISQAELALLLSLRGRLKQLQSDIAAEEESLKNRLQAGAVIEPRDHTAELMIAKIVEERVLEALAHPIDAEFQPFFQSKQVADEIKRRQTVTEQHKFSYAYEDWGCLVCGTKERPHYAIWMCENSHARATQRLRSSIRRRSPDANQPQPTFTDTVKLARAALAPSLETLAKDRRGK